jgi:Holliday junction resolvase-like predicted endonuclease
MDDDEYLNSLVDKASSENVTYGWYDCVDGFKQADVDMCGAFHRKLDWMIKAADIYLSDNNKMAGFVGKFSEDCGISYQYGRKINAIRKTFVDCKLQNFSSDVMYALLSAPEELREEIVSSGKPVTVAEVKEAKAGYKEVKENPDYGDILEDVKEKRKTPLNAAKEAWDRSEKKRKEMERAPNVFDLNAHIKSTEHCSVDVSAVNLVVAMEQLISKFDRNDVMTYLHAAIQDDVVNIKIPALHEMADILTELCEQLPLSGTTNQNVN